MGGGSRQTQTTQNQMSPELRQYLNYMNSNVLPDIGTGRLNPMIPADFILNAPLNPLASNSANVLGNFLNSGLIPATTNAGLAGAMGLSQGNVANNPLSQVFGNLTGDLTSAFQRLLRGEGLGGGQINGMPPGFNAGSVGGGTQIMLSGGGGYNPMTNADIQSTIDATNDDLARAFERNELLNIRRNAIAGGGLGGSRQGIAEGVASEGLGRAMLSNAGQMRVSMDNNERNRLAQLAASQMQMEAASAGAGSNYQLGMANLQAEREANLLRTMLGAAQTGGGLLGEGFNLGMNATQSGLGLLPSMLGLTNQATLPIMAAGMDLTNFNQQGIDRELARLLQNGSVRVQDLGLYNQLFNPAVVGQFGTQTTTTQSRPSFLSQLGQIAGIGAMVAAGPFAGLFGLAGSAGAAGAGTLSSLGGLGGMGILSSLYGGPQVMSAPLGFGRG